MENNIDLTKKYYSIKRELKGPMLADDFKFIEASTMPVAGVYEGLEGLLNVVPTLLAMFDIKRWHIKEYTAGGEYVVALMELWSEDTDGSEIHMEVAEVFHWKAGKLHEIKPCWFDISALERAIVAKKKKTSKSQSS